MPQELDECVLSDLLGAGVIVQDEVDRSNHGEILDGKQPSEFLGAVHARPFSGPFKPLTGTERREALLRGVDCAHQLSKLADVRPTLGLVRGTSSIPLPSTE